MDTQKIHQQLIKMSKQIAFIIEALLRLGMRVLQAVDESRAASFRASVRDDPVGVLINQLGGQKNNTTSNIAQSAKSDDERDTRGMD